MGNTFMKHLLYMLTLSAMIFSCNEYTAVSGEIYVETTGVFDARIVVAGNFHYERVYIINQYCISADELSQEQADKYKGRKVLVSGILKIVKGTYGPVKSSTDGTIYEPLKEPDLMFIVNPKFIILK